MTQEDKALLLKDLCARLPYNVICQVEFKENGKYKSKVMLLSGIFTDEAYFTTKGGSIYSNEYKPYLFPLSSMTEEMLKELNTNGFFKYRDDITNVSNIESKNGISKEIYTYIDIESISFLTDYFHSNHIDYRGLIEKSLALDATNLGVYE